MLAEDEVGDRQNISLVLDKPPVTATVGMGKLNSLIKMEAVMN